MNPREKRQPIATDVPRFWLGANFVGDQTSFSLQRERTVHASYYPDGSSKTLTPVSPVPRNLVLGLDAVEAVTANRGQAEGVGAFFVTFLDQIERMV